MSQKIAFLVDCCFSYQQKPTTGQVKWLLLTRACRNCCLLMEEAETPDG